LIFHRKARKSGRFWDWGMGSEAGVGARVVTAIHVAPVEIDSDREPTTSVPLPIFRPSCDPSPSQTTSGADPGGLPRVLRAHPAGSKRDAGADVAGAGGFDGLDRPLHRRGLVVGQLDQKAHVQVAHGVLAFHAL